MKKVLFIDRDGTLIAEPKDFQVDSFAKLKFLSFVVTYLAGGSDGFEPKKKFV
jgi:imidazoleglycerol-phosphate dehydratase/histidinol-phosphatase